MVYKIERIKPHYLELATVTITAGGTEKKLVKVSDDITIEDLVFIETAGADTKKITVTMRVEDEVVMHDRAPVYLFDITNQNRYKITFSVRANEEIEFGFENNDTVDANITIIAVITK